jgi:hypothetical protein
MNIQRISTMFILSAGLVLASSAQAQSDDPTPSTKPIPLKLLNGWFNAPYSTSDAEVAIIDGIVHFKGAIATNGKSNEAFVLPKGFRPTHLVVIPVDMCGASYGVLGIQPDGVVDVSTILPWSDAQCFTSLDGASFAPGSTGFTALKPINGWTNVPSDSSPEIAKIDGIVHLKGAIMTSDTNKDSEPFVLPKEFRPDTYISVPVTMCYGTIGQLNIDQEGQMFVQAETEGDAQCFTSLDGAWFAANDSGFKALTLLNGWTSEYDPAVSISQGVVSFQGAIYTSGNKAEPFVLPPSYRPATNVYVPVTLCNGADGNEIDNGRLIIQPNGVVNVQPENAFSEAQCLTSLDGASFVK